MGATSVSSTQQSTSPRDIEQQPLADITPTKKPRSFYITVVSICLCVFIATVNTINFASALPAVASSLSASTSQAFWCGTVLLFAQSIAQPIYGAAAEAFGRKSCMLVALVIFALGSLLAALAQDVQWLIGVRAVQGLGGGGINVCVNVIIVDLVPRRERAKLSGIVSLSGAIGLVVGVLTGSATAQKNWRLMFWINLPIAGVAFILFLFFLPLEQGREHPLSKLRTLDWTGIAICAGSVAGILFGLISGGTEYPWSSANVLVPLIVGGFGIAGFLAFENSVAGKYGFGPAFIPLRLFSNRTAAFGYLITLLQAMVLWAIPYYFLLYLHISASKSLIQSSVLTLPSTLALPIAAAVAGILMSKLSHFKYFNIVAFVLMTAGCAGLSTLRDEPTTGQIVGFQILFSLGGGILFPGRLVAVQAGQRELSSGKPDDKADVRMATSLVSFTTSLGQALGIAMGSTALQSRWNPLVAQAVETGRLPNNSTYILLGSQAARSADIIAHFPDSISAVYRDIAAKSVAKVWYICVGASALGVLAALASRNLNLDNHGSNQDQIEGLSSETK